LFSVFGLLAQDEAADTSTELVDAVREGLTRRHPSSGSGRDANTKTDGGMPVVALAAMKGHAAVVDALVKAGADLAAKDKAGATALMYAAAQFGHNDVVQSLIAAGADVNAKDNLGWTPLIRRPSGATLEGTTALLAAGADKNATDFFGRNALQVAEGLRPRERHRGLKARFQGNAKAQSSRTQRKPNSSAELLRLCAFAFFPVFTSRRPS
jgi:ankyrin repeat protein